MRKGKTRQRKLELIQFEVSSIGYKWIKVKTSDNYENKILIQDAPDLEEGKHYSVQAKQKWFKSQYGYSVQLEEVQDITEIRAFCISCRQPTDGKYHLCYSCNSQYKNNAKSLEFHYCKTCGKNKPTISIDNPICKVCVKTKKEDQIRATPPKNTPPNKEMGFCIQCGKQIPYDSHFIKIRCRTCWKKDKEGITKGKICYHCGQNYLSLVKKPLCLKCYTNFKLNALCE